MKTVTKHFLLLSLMVFGVAGAAWADRAPKQWTTQVDLQDLVQGDTLSQGFSLTNQSNRYLKINADGVKRNGNVPSSTVSIGSALISQITYGDNSAISVSSNTFTPWTGTEAGNAWVVTDISDGDPYLSGIKIAGPNDPVKDELTGNWNFLMPSGSRKVNVQFYNDYKLMNIPEGWTVKVYDQPVALQGDTATIYESAQVTLVPTDPRRVRIVTLEDAPSAQTVSVNGVDLLIAEGDTWQDIINRNSSKLYLYNGSSVATYGGYTLGKNGCDPVLPSEPYDPSITYNWCMG